MNEGPGAKPGLAGGREGLYLGLCGGCDLDRLLVLLAVQGVGDPPAGGQGKETEKDQSYGQDPVRGEWAVSLRDKAASRSTCDSGSHDKTEPRSHHATPVGSVCRLDQRGLIRNRVDRIANGGNQQGGGDYLNLAAQRHCQRKKSGHEKAGSRGPHGAYSLRAANCYRPDKHSYGHHDLKR